MGTTAKGVPYPDSGDSPDGPAQIQAVADWVDDNPGIGAFTYAQINALAGADLWEGRRVYQSNTGTDRPVEGEYTYNGVNWRLPWNMPWGFSPNGVASITANQSGIGAQANITGLTLTNTFVANRYLRVGLMFRITKATTGEWSVQIGDGTTDHTVAANNTADGISVSGATMWLPALTTAGSVTFQVKAIGNATAGTVAAVATTANPWRLICEDTGPAGVPA